MVRKLTLNEERAFLQTDGRIWREYIRRLGSSNPALAKELEMERNRVLQKSSASHYAESKTEEMGTPETLAKSDLFQALDELAGAD